MAKAGIANIADRRIFKDRSDAGKGDKPRPKNDDKWYNAPLWKNFGPDARKAKTNDRH